MAPGSNERPRRPAKRAGHQALVVGAVCALFGLGGCAGDDRTGTSTNCPLRKPELDASMHVTGEDPFGMAELGRRIYGARFEISDDGRTINAPGEDYPSVEISFLPDGRPHALVIVQDPVHDTAADQIEQKIRSAGCRLVEGGSVLESPSTT